MLETGFDPRSGKLVFTKNSCDPLKADAVIVDETSMVDVPLMAALLDALEGDCRLVLVGDPDQLPSVGPGALFADLIRSGVVPAFQSGWVSPPTRSRCCPPPAAGGRAPAP